jgi:hypothetical protein
MEDCIKLAFETFESIRGESEGKITQVYRVKEKLSTGTLAIGYYFHTVVLMGLLNNHHAQ